MVPALTISARAMGRRKPLLPDWSLPLPPGEPGGEPITLRRVITRIVHRELGEFERRREERRFVRILTERQIEEGLTRGRVDPGGRVQQGAVDVSASVAAALQAFEDGLYLVILDGEELRELDREVHLRPTSHLVFVRLVMLAGG
jgi:hypothetical protein